MACCSLPSRIAAVAITLTLLFTLLFFFFFLSQSPNPPFRDPVVPRRSLLNSTIAESCISILEIPPQSRCSFALLHCSGDSNGLFNYFSLHFCTFRGNPYLSIPFLSLAVLLQLYILVKAAQDHFSVVVTKLCTHLNLSPSMGAVTLLALGNGAPDVFASVAAVGGGHLRTGFGAILSAGTFVSAFVVGVVAIYAAPFSLKPVTFVRDVLFYLIAASFLFYVYLSGEIFVWQAVGFVGFYLFFVGFVFWMDLGMGSGKGKPDAETGFAGEVGISKGLAEFDCEARESYAKFERHKSWIWRTCEKVSKVWEIPVSTLLRLTIPQASPWEWSRFYLSANIVLCPLLLLYSCKSLVPYSHPVFFLLPNTHFPLWLIVLFGTSSLAVVHFILEKDHPKAEQLPIVIVAFVMSVFWISSVAGELLNCLSALGLLLQLPSVLLGLTVLAWGNSVGDLVADVAVAKAGQPAMAMAGCFVGPMFNMLFGLGSSLVMQTVRIYPGAYELEFNMSIVIAFVFLLLSLMGSMLVVTWCQFRVPRSWGFCLVGLYTAFIALSLLITLI